LFADGQMEQTFKGFLERESFHLSLGTRPFTYDNIVDRQNNDPGVYKRGHELLHRFYGECHHAIAVLDNEWEGSPGPEIIQRHMKENLARKGWRKEDVEIIVIVPELEIWLWQDSPHVAAAFRFDHPLQPSLKKWLEVRGHWH